MAKNKVSPKNLELDVNVAKNCGILLALQISSVSKLMRVGAAKNGNKFDNQNK